MGNIQTAMRKLITILFLVSALLSQGQYTKHNLVAGTWSNWGGVTVTGIRMAFLLHMPAANPNGRLPALIIFLHGIDHRGPLPTGPTNYGTIDVVAAKGIPLQIATTDLPLMTIPGGTSPQDDISFAVAAMQCYTGFSTWPPAYQAELLAWLKTNYAGQIDFTRVYVVGYSLGGGGALGVLGTPSMLPQVAWVGVEAPGYTGATNYQQIADANIGVTVYATVNDPLANISIADNWVRTLNTYNPLSPVQYLRFNDLPNTLGGATQHDRIWPVVNNLTPGTSYGLTNGDTWVQTTMLKRALSFTTKRATR
jgi:predicted peptidase